MLNELNIIVVDCETTGLDPTQHEIIQIAAVVYDPTKKEIVKEWCRKVMPREIEFADPEALRVNGYNEADWEHAEDIKTVIEEFYDLIQGSMVLGQNLEFDLGFISKYYRRLGLKNEVVHRHRKLELTSLVWPLLKNKVESLSLASICNVLGVSNTGAHDALIDCRRTLEVYIKVMELYGALD